MKSPKFTAQTFQYFDQATKNRNNLEWFEKNREKYESAVRDPFSNLVEQIQQKLQKDLPRVPIQAKSIARPLRAKNRAAREGGLIKNFSHITIFEKRSSLFEWNPGIHIQFGAKPDDNFVGLGLYMVSSRQLSLLRQALSDDFDEINGILNNRALKKVWGGVQGEKYVRFPKGFNAEDPQNIYLWHKQFYLSRQFKRSEVVSSTFTKTLCQDLKTAMPFLAWIRNKVGIYQRN